MKRRGGKVSASGQDADPEGSPEASGRVERVASRTSNSRTNSFSICNYKPSLHNPFIICNYKIPFSILPGICNYETPPGGVPPRKSKSPRGEYVQPFPAT